MKCPACNKDLIIDQYEDIDLVYCSCGYTQMEESMCDEQEEAYFESLASSGEIHPSLIEDN